MSKGDRVKLTPQAVALAMGGVCGRPRRHDSFDWADRRGTIVGISRSRRDAYVLLWDGFKSGRHFFTFELEAA